MTEAERIEKKFTWHTGDLRKVTPEELQKGCSNAHKETDRIKPERKSDNGKIH